MVKRSASLHSAYADLLSRYGAADPLVLDLKNTIDSLGTPTTVLPFGERRKSSVPRAVWPQQGPGHMASHEMPHAR